MALRLVAIARRNVLHVAILFIRLFILAVICLLETARKFEGRFKKFGSSFSPKTSNLPRHVAFVLNDELLVENLAPLLTTCWQLGICELSVYRALSWSNGLKESLIDHCYATLPKGEKLSPIAFLEPSQSMASLVSDVKTMATQWNNGQDEANNYLLKQKKFGQQVDLLILFGGGGTLLGYPSLSLSWAEIYQLPNLSKASTRHLLNAITMFAQTERRFGR